MRAAVMHSRAGLAAAPASHRFQSLDAVASGLHLLVVGRLRRDLEDGHLRAVLSGGALVVRPCSPGAGVGRTELVGEGRAAADQRLQLCKHPAACASRSH